MISRSQKTHLLALMMIVGLMINITYHYWLGAYDNLSYPYNTFLFVPRVHFSDYTSVTREGGSLNPYLGYKSAQYPLLVLVGYLFSLLPFSIYIYFFLLIAGLLFFCILFLREGGWLEYAINIFIISLLSYPVLITIDRGNFEGLVAVVLLAFAYFFMQKRYAASAILLAIAISLKLLPVVLLALFIPERRYREIGICIVVTLLLTLASLLCFQGGLAANLNFLLHASNITSNPFFGYFTNFKGDVVQRGTSLITLIKIIQREFGAWTNYIDYFGENLIKIYVILAGLVGIIMALYTIFIEKETWKRFAILTFAMLILPTISADYKLLHIYMPLYLFINSPKKSRLDLIYLILFGLLLVPKDYYYLQHIGSEAGFDISLSVPFNILILMAFSAILMISGAKDRLQGWLKSKSRISPSASTSLGA